MSIENIFSVGAYLCGLILLTPMLGNYLAHALFGKRVWLSSVIGPCERIIYRICFVNPQESMHWQQYARAVFWFSALSVVLVFTLQIFQHILPLNPQGFPSVPGAVAFNTAVSFVTNTNWQAYSGEDTLSYLTQSLGLSVQSFLSASVGMAVLIAFIRGLKQKQHSTIGNFWVDVTRSFLYVLLPLSCVLALLLISQGVVQNFSNYVVAQTVEGREQILPMGPVASQIAIKQLGSNGGGFFSSNSAHPFENPTPLSNFLQMLALLLIPSSLVYMFGVVINDRRHALMIYLVMLSMFILFMMMSLWSEYLGNPSLNLPYALEGKEVRFGNTASIIWSTATTSSANGSVNSMHDSLSPLAGGLALLPILLGEVIFGGVGSGLYGMLLFVLLTVFLAGLMVGRTPEYLGKKIEIFDMQMVVLAIILPSATVLVGTALSCALPSVLTNLANHGPHGLTELLYAWASTTNNNGSAFAGLNVNNGFFNFALALSMLIGRFAVIFPVLAIAGNLANKRRSPTSSATLATDTVIFAILLAFVVIVVGALTFFPALSLGPIIEHFLMQAGHNF